VLALDGVSGDRKKCAWGFAPKDRRSVAGNRGNEAGKKADESERRTSREGQLERSLDTSRPRLLTSSLGGGRSGLTVRSANRSPWVSNEHKRRDGRRGDAELTLNCLTVFRGPSKPSRCFSR
jgi:hypothetical protein